MVQGVFQHLAESQRSHAWSALAVVEGEGTGDRSFPTGQGVLRGNWHRTHCCLTRLCWGLLPRAVFRRRERGTISHAITFLDDKAVHIPMLDAWDQLVWPPSAAVPQTATEVEQYGYCRGRAIDLSPVMPAMEFRVMDEEGCTCVWHRPSYSRGVSWHIILPGTR